MNTTPTNLIGALVLFFAMGLLALLVKSKPKKPIRPDHNISVRFDEIPVYDIDNYPRVDSEKFVIVQLKDGHDYWLFVDRSRDRGLAALTHCQECEKCSMAKK